MIAVVVFTDGRLDCISRTLESFDEHVAPQLPAGRNWRFIVDDSATPEYRAELCARWQDGRGGGDRWQVLSNPRRLGFGGTIARAWQALLVLPGAADGPRPEFVFHLEDDFTFNEAVPLEDMTRVLDSRPQLVQLALRRQAWSRAEREAGGVIESHPDAYREVGALLPVERSLLAEDARPVWWLEHRLFFTTNPSLYRLSLCERGWPEGRQSEGRFALDLFAEQPDAVCGFWGARTDPPRVEHIGTIRTGGGY